MGFLGWEDCKSFPLFLFLVLPVHEGMLQMRESEVLMVVTRACICAVLRLFYTIRLYSSTDTTFVGAQVGKLIEPELTFGFLAACLPVLPVFVKHVSNGSCRLWTSQTVPSQTRHSPTMLGSTRLGNIYNRPRQDGGIRKEVKTEIEFSQVDVSEVRAEEWRRETWAEEVGTESSRRSGLEAPRVWS